MRDLEATEQRRHDQGKLDEQNKLRARLKDDSRASSSLRILPPGSQRLFNQVGHDGYSHVAASSGSQLDSVFRPSRNYSTRPAHRAVEYDPS